MDEYKIKRSDVDIPHGNTKRGLPFHKLEVGEYFEVPPDDYGRTNSARAHYQKRMLAKGQRVKFSSRAVKDAAGAIKGYVFRRDQ